MSGESTDKVQQRAQTFFNKGAAALRTGNWNIAIDLLMQCVTILPGFDNARKLLRGAQIAKYKSQKHGSLASQMSDLKCSIMRMKVQGLLKTGKKQAALLECEKILSINPLQADNVELAIACADANDLPNAALFTVEAALENNPNDMTMQERAGAYYMQVGEFGKARDAYVKLNAVRPHDQRILKLLKDAEARTTMAEGGWEENAGKRGGYKNLIRDKELAAKIDSKNKQVAVGDDAETLIAEAKAKIEKEPANLNQYRALARIYITNKRYPEAIETLEAARQVNPADPELDRALTNAKTLQYNAEIEALTAAGDLENAALKTQERDQYVFNDLYERVARYPNDLKLHFDLGQQYFKYEYWDEAISQFQLSQRSPKEKVESLYYLALCFAKKGQTDMAIMQLETANDQLVKVDNLKLRIMYALGDIAEQGGDIEKAFKYFQGVYSADIGFQDIDQRFQKIYALHKAQQGQ